MAQGRTLMSTRQRLAGRPRSTGRPFWALTAVMAVPGSCCCCWIMRLYPDEKQIVPAGAEADQTSRASRSSIAPSAAG